MPKKHQPSDVQLLKEQSTGNVIKVGDIDIAIKSVPVTTRRKPFINHGQIKEAGLARAYTAPTSDRPHGNAEYASMHKHQTVLQQHVDFFDPDHDGIIWPLDTFIGFHMIGFNLVLCIIATLVIHSGFSYPTNPSWIPDPFFRLWIKNMHKAMHGSDSDSYDSEGRFVRQKFEDMWAKYSSSPEADTLSTSDIINVHKGNRNAMDPFGWFAAAFELFALWWLLKDKNGVVHKSEARGVYDGSIFYERWEKQKNAEPWYWNWLTEGRIQ